MLYDCIRYLRPVQTYAAGIVDNFGDMIEDVIDLISQFFPAAKDTLGKHFLATGIQNFLL